MMYGIQNRESKKESEKNSMRRKRCEIFRVCDYESHTGHLHITIGFKIIITSICLAIGNRHDG